MDRPPAWERIQAAFHEALELDRDRRAEWLARLGREDPALAREVESLLAAHDESTGFLAGTAAADAAAGLSPGDRLGPYRIVGEIGRGGMGVVYRAMRDDDDFQRDVALKLIFPGVHSADLLSRFRAERRILAMLDHPSIVRLVDGGTTPDGRPFLVMDFVDGRPLLDWCDDRSSGIEERIRLFLDVCAAVQFAHQRLVIHRDLKPDNILVTADGSPRLLDFGIAKLAAPDPSDPSPRVTAPMERLMTPDYASPEQVRGEPVTVAADVYSLGVVLYELLTGRLPLRLTTRTTEEIIRVIGREDPPPPSSVTGAAEASRAADRRGVTASALRRRLSGDLDQIVLKALEKEPADRYASVAHLAEDLRRHLEGHPVLARRHSTGYIVSRFVRRNRGAVVAGGLVALALVAGLAGTAWQAGRAARERDRANRRFEEVKALAHAVIFDIHDAIVDLPGSTPAREELVAHALRYLDSLAREVSSDPTLERELGVAYGKIGDVQGRPYFSNLGKTEEALASYDRSVELLTKASRARPDSIDFSRDLALSLQRRGDLLWKTGRRDDALAQAAEALALIESALTRQPDHEFLPGDILVAHDRIGDMKLAAGDTAGAVEERRFCMDYSEERFRKDPQDAGWRRSMIINCAKSAELLAAAGQRGGAAESYRRAERLAREAVGALGHNTEARRDLSIVYGMYGLFLADGGDVDSALAWYGKGMRISEELSAEDPENRLFRADVAGGHLDTGGMLVRANRHGEAHRAFESAFEAFARLATRDSTDVESRLGQARSARRLGEMCETLASAGPDADRPRRRLEARAWRSRALLVYEDLERRGALDGEEANAPAELRREVGAPPGR